MISAVILAAGKSSRMGRPKQQMRLGGGTVLGRVIEIFRNSIAEEIIVVLGPDSHADESELHDVRVVTNRESPVLSASLRAGVGALRRESEAALFGLADKPFLTVETINRLIDTYKRSGAGILVPVFRGRRGNPVLFSRKFFDELSSLSGDLGGKEVIRRHKSSVLEVDVGDEGILIDIDTPQDYQKAKSLLSQSRKRSSK